MYATRADIEEIIGIDQLAVVATRDVDAGVSDDAINKALADASGFIDGHVGERYSLPLTSPAPLLRRPCVDIVVYYLAQGATLMTEDIKARYDDARKVLKDIANGVIKLTLDTDGDGRSESERRVISVQGPDRIFTRDTLRRF